MGCITSATCLETHLWAGNGPDNVPGGTVELPHTVAELGRWKRVKVDVAVVPIHTMLTYMGNEEFHPFLTSVLGAGSPQYKSNTKLGGPHSWSGHFGGREKYLAPVEIRIAGRQAQFWKGNMRNWEGGHAPPPS